MRKMDILTVLVILFSLFLFMKSQKSKPETLGITIYEGEPVAGGRTGFAELSFLNALNYSMNCNVSVRVYQSAGVKYENKTALSFPPGISYQNISIFLPDGKNEVKLGVEC